MVSFSVIITLCHVDISNVSWKIAEELLKRWKSGLFYLAKISPREITENSKIRDIRDN